MTKGRRGLSLALIVAVTGLFSGCDDDDGGIGQTGTPPLAGTSIKVLSGRADMVTGGDALVEVVTPAGAVPAIRKDAWKAASAYSRSAAGYPCS